jgi:peptide/nickel transport system substrate-binding protein
MMASTVGLAAGSLPAAAKDSIVIAYPADVPSWDANAHTFPMAMSIWKSVFDSPLTQRPDLTLAPNVITAWKWTDDGLGFEVTLRDDVYFHNGDKLTAEDLRFTFFERLDADRKGDKKLAISGVWGRVKDIEVVSPTKAVFRLSAANPTMPQWLAFLGSFIVPKKYFTKVGKEGFLKKPIGSGPYKLADYQRGSRIVLEANEKYWGGAPKFKRVTFEVVKDASARVAAIQSKRVDLTIQVPIREALRLGKISGLETDIYPFTQILMLQITGSGVFSDANVRLAAHHAIDKAAISKALFNGSAVPLSVLAPPTTPGHVPGFNFAHDPDKAKSLLAASGYSTSKPAKLKMLTTNGAFPNDFEMARAIGAMWKKVGIEAEIEVIELSKYYELNHSNKLPEATLYSWGNATGDPEIYTGYILNPKFRFAAWRSDDMGDMIGKLFGEVDYEKRIKGYQDVNKYVVEKGYAIPLLQGVTTAVWQSNLNFKRYNNGWILPAEYSSK